DALKGWRNAGYMVPSVGLNFASRQLLDTAIINQIKWLVDGAGLQPEDVTVEVLESVLSSSHSDDLIENVKALSAAGFSIDLDDFGTEHASIANMRSFEVQRIKIDKSFVQDIETRPDQRRLVSAMVQLARSLDVEVLAEGVETGAEIEILSELGCNQVQGYFFARPMEYEQSLTWLSQCGLIERSNVAQDLQTALF
ncbi:MAG: EAL domain-containing protein, partial [Paracoccaceae bacterium]